MTTKTQYLTTIPFLNGVALPSTTQGLPKWVDERSAQRLAAYELYDDVYANNPNTYVLLLRGAEERPIYVPSGRKIIDTMNRYVARDFGFTIEDSDPNVEVPEEQIINAVYAVESFFKRERFRSRFNSAKRRGLVRGDACLYIYADASKPQGSRISVKWIHPGSYFPIAASDDADRVVGCDIAELFTGADGKEYVKVQRYIKGNHPDHPAYDAEAETEQEAGAEILYFCWEMKADKWQDPEERDITKTLVNGEVIPGITQLPVYHFKNMGEDGIAFGRSELSGLEHIIAGINQAVTDQDLALAMGGLGLFVTNAGAPVDENGDESNWVLGPRRVIEIEGNGKESWFERVTGVPTTEPSLKHIEYLEDQMNSTLGISDVVTGQVDVQVAESGVALAIRMGPIIDSANEKEEIIADVMRQFLYDLKSWFLSFEQINLGTLELVPTFGEKMPRNRDAEFQELLSLLAEGIVTVEYVIGRLREKFGYEDIPESMIKEVTDARLGGSGDQQMNAETNPPDDGVEGDAPADPDLDGE